MCDINRVNKSLDLAFTSSHSGDTRPAKAAHKPLNTWLRHSPGTFSLSPDPHIALHSTASALETQRVLQLTLYTSQYDYE